MSAPSIEIATSKTKLAIMIPVCAAFIANGIWFIINPISLQKGIFRGTFGVLFIETIGIATALLFGILLVFLIQRLRNNKPGLIINETGLIDNSSAIPGGFIPWNDISNIIEITVAKNRFLLIKVKNPGVYISRHTGFLKRKAVEYNYKTYGTPICISSKTLQFSFDELKILLHQKLSAYNAFSATI